MRLREKKEARSDIYVGSMADISFLLVIFFIVTSVIVASRGLDLNFEPPPEDATEVDPQDSIHILVHADGSLEVDNRPMALAELLSYIKPKLEQRADKPVILQTDPNAHYLDMMVVLDELRQAPEKQGFEVANLVIPTQREIDTDWARAGLGSG